jgi:hypothetical protein
MVIINTPLQSTVSFNHSTPSLYWYSLFIGDLFDWDSRYWLIDWLCAVLRPVVNISGHVQQY